MEQIVFLDRSTLEATIRRPAFPHQWEEYATTAPGEIVGRLKDATIVITNKVPLRAEAMAQLPRLRLIAEAARRQSLARTRPAQSDRHPPHRLGKLRGHADPGGSAHRQHRGVCCGCPPQFGYLMAGSTFPRGSLAVAAKDNISRIFASFAVNAFSN